MYATRIRMKPGCSRSNRLTEIKELYLECAKPGYYTKEDLHDHLKTHPKSIKVKISPFPFLVPATSVNGEKYVRSAPNDTPNDNLLRLPRG